MDINDLTLIHSDDWSSYEENGEIEIYQCDKRYFYREGSNMVFAEVDEPYWSNLVEINEDQVLELIEQWENN